MLMEILMACLSWSQRARSIGHKLTKEFPYHHQSPSLLPVVFLQCQNTHLHSPLDKHLLIDQPSKENLSHDLGNLKLFRVIHVYIRLTTINTLQQCLVIKWWNEGIHRLDLPRNSHNNARTKVTRKWFSIMKLMEISWAKCTVSILAVGKRESNRQASTK